MARFAIMHDITKSSSRQPAIKAETTPDLPGNKPFVRKEASNSKEDHHDERVMAEFTGRQLYKLWGKDIGIEFSPQNRKTSVGAQKSGVDFFGEKSTVDEYGRKDTTLYRIDEKCSLYYINGKLNTFALELRGVNRRNEAQTGWFVNEEHTTTHYNFLYPYLTVEKLTPGTLELEQIRGAEGILVRKKTLQEYLEKSGLPLQRLLRLEKELAAKRASGRQEDICPGIHCTVSDNLNEKPFNLIVSKKILLSICEQHFAIDWDGYKIMGRDEKYTPPGG